MKKILLFSITAFTAFTTINNPAKDIVGIWKIDQSSIDEAAAAVINYTAKSKPEAAKQMEGQLASIKAFIRHTTFEYKADNTYNFDTPQGILSGKWSFSADNKYLIITRPAKPDRLDSVLEITSTRLVLYNKERGDTSLFVHP
ncbi:hypothetical protein BH11BAC3_BH11BAC3_06970 [soil metagenome]